MAQFKYKYGAGRHTCSTQFSHPPTRVQILTAIFIHIKLTLVSVPETSTLAMMISPPRVLTGPFSKSPDSTLALTTWRVRTAVSAVALSRRAGTSTTSKAALTGAKTVNGPSEIIDLIWCCEIKAKLQALVCHFLLKLRLNTHCSILIIFRRSLKI